jgi:hypothetical protein
MADEPVLTPTPEGATVRYRGRHLYSPGTPRTSAEGRARSVERLERTLYFVPCLGLGYGLDALLERCPASSHILCVETDQLLMAMGCSGSGGALPRDPRLTIVRTSDPSALAGIVLRMGVGRFRRCRLVNLCGGYLLERDLYDSMFRTLESLLAEHWQNRMTSMHLGALWVKNCLENLLLLARSSPLEGLRAEGPVVVVGAGPSLGRSIAALRLLRDKARLVAVDTALPVLTAHGIRPDVLVILEAQQANLYDFLPKADPSIPVVADLTAHPGSLRLWSGPLAFVLSSFAGLALFDRMEEARLLPRRIPPLGSVGVAACAVALELTEAEVLTCGLDFAYDRDRTHAPGAPLHTQGLVKADRLHPALSFFYGIMRRRPLLKDAAGGPATDAVMRSYAGSLRALAGSAGRIRRMAPDGSTSSWAESPGGAEPLVEARSRREAAPWSPQDGTALEGFYANEIELCGRALDAIGRMLDGASAPEDARALRAVDYAAVHMPESAGDEGVPEHPTRSYLARLRQAVLVYRARLGRLARRARGTDSPPSTAPRA